LLPIALAAATCTIAIAACGSSTKPTGTTASNLPSRLAFANCMRSHAVPNFPDGPNVPDGIAQSPAFQKAAQTCRSKLQPGGGPHYPDPTIPSHGPYDFGPPPGINTNAPAFQHATAECGGP
jgi:hypothetical protein